MEEKARTDHVSSRIPEIDERAAQRQYRELFESNLDGIVLVGMDGRILDANQAYLDMLGYSKEEIKSMTYQQITPEKWNPVEASIVQEQVARRGYADEYEKENVRKDGSIFPVSVRTWIHKDGQGNPVGMWRIVRDITERRILEEERLKSATFEEAVIGMVHTSPDGRFLRVNPKFCECTGYTREELLGLTFQKITHPDDLTISTAQVQQLIAGERSIFSQEKRYIRKDGRVFWANVTSSLVRDAEGKPLYFNTLIENVTERKLMEEKLKETQEKLIKQEKLAMIGKLAGSVSHELRNPLGAILNSLYYLSMKIPKSDEKIAKHLKLAQEQGARATKIISDLLDFTRIQPGDPRAANIHDMLDHALELANISRQVTVKTTYSGKPLKVFCDPGKIQQAFINIITNAVQAMNNSGELEITTILDENEVRISFKDSGIGIPKENMSRLFEPLFSTKVSGIGLGLVITKEIVEQYKGQIQVSSTEGSGTTFTIRLPVVN